MKKHISLNFILGFCLIVAFFGFKPQAAHAISDGALMWSSNGQPRGDRNGSWVNYYSNQGAQGTYWVWRVQKYYPEFTLYCSAAGKNVCTATKMEGRFEYITRQLTIKFELKGTFNGIAGGVGFDASKAWTTGSNFTIGQTISISPGYNAYAMIIALDKYVPAADWGGAWLRTGKTRSTCPPKGYPCGPLEYEMRWNQGYVFGVWSGHMVTHARALMCATKTTTVPQVGGGVPSGCTLPAIPY